MSTTKHLSFEERCALRRLAEDAIRACNRHHGPFVEAVAHPLNIAALLDMADSAADIADLLDLEGDKDIVDEVAQLLEGDGQLMELAQRVQTWHADGMKQTREIQGCVEEGTSVQCGIDGADDKKLQLTAREALIFKLGMEAGLAFFEKLPFSLSHQGGEEEVPE